MVEQVKEIRPESQALPFAELETLVQRKIHIFLRRPDDAVPGRVAVKRSVARFTVGERRRQRIRRVSSRIHPIGQPRRDASRARRIAATKARTESGCRGRARQRICTASGWIIDREWRSRLQDYHSAGFPSAQCRLGDSVGVCEEGKLVDGTGYEALSPVEIGEAAGGRCIRLVVDAG